MQGHNGPRKCSGENLAYSCENVVDGAKTVYVANNSRRTVMLDAGLTLILVRIDAILNHLRVGVVGGPWGWGRDQGTREG